MKSPPASETTRLLRAWDRHADLPTDVHERLLELVYAELHGIARGLMARERADHTLQPTALVHEAWLRLVDASQLAFKDRSHFLGIAARSMRQVLVDHARGRGAAKRGGDRRRVTLVDDLVAGESRALELLALDDAMNRLAELDARAARVAEGRIFGGMTVAELAEDLEVSTRTVEGDWTMARLWLSRALQAG
jgi:RNA polymerase sigma factor (TIGR02999 family)